MKKKIIIGIAGFAVAFIIGTIIFINLNKSNTPAPELNQEPSKQEITSNLWDDQAGFTFQYPPDVTIDKHDEDEENYAHVELTQKDHPGNLKVWVKDTTAADIAAWVKTEKRLKGATITDTMLGGQAAKEIRLAGADNLMLVAAIYDDLLFSIETTLGDSGYWTKIYEQVADSFAFKPPEPQEGTQAVGENWIDEEEVIE